MDGIFLGARIVKARPTGAAIACSMLAVPEGMASTASTWLYGLQQNTETRTNLALLNTGDTDGAPDVFAVETLRRRDRPEGQYD